MPRALPRRAWGLVVRRVRYEFFMNAMMDRAATLTFFTVLTALPMVLGVYSIAPLVLARKEQQVQKLTADFIGTYLPPVDILEFRKNTGIHSSTSAWPPLNGLNPR